MGKNVAQQVSSAAGGTVVLTSRTLMIYPRYAMSLVSLGQWFENQGMAFGPFYGRPFLLGSVVAGGTAAALAGAAYYFSRD